MKFGLFAPLISPIANGVYLRALGEGAERYGFESVWVPEHVVLFDEYDSAYPYADDGKLPAPADNGWLEPWTTLSYLAACTSTVRLGTGICILPQRNPVYAAKTIANADFISGGRIDVGIGVGWLAEEFEVVGVPFEKRGERTDSCIEVMKKLWCDDVTEHRDSFYDVPSCRMSPKPVQSPHPPLHIGGNSASAMRRVARAGSGWLGYQLRPDEVQSSVAQLTEILDQHGRNREDVEVTICHGMIPMEDEWFEAYEAAGVDRLLILTAAFDSTSLSEAIARAAERSDL